MLSQNFTDENNNPIGKQVWLYLNLNSVIQHFSWRVHLDPFDQTMSDIILKQILKFQTMLKVMNHGVIKRAVNRHEAIYENL